AASLTAAGERMLAEEDRIGQKIDLLLVALDLEEHAGLVLTEGEVDAARSLEDLVRAAAGPLHPAADCEAGGAELVGEAVRRAAPRVLGGVVSNSRAGG